MKGLTPEEKAYLEYCCRPYDPNAGSEADPHAAAVLDGLVKAGRLAIVEVEGGLIYQTTSTGKVAIECANAVVPPKVT